MLRRGGGRQPRRALGSTGGGHAASPIPASAGAVTRLAYGRDVDFRSQAPGWSAAFRAAEELAADVGSGLPLPKLQAPIGLEHGEALHASSSLSAWRFSSADVVIEHRRLVGRSSLGSLALAAAANSIAARRAGAAARRIAAPQWRPLGVVQVLATNRRLLVLHESAWWSVWYSAITRVALDAEVGRLELCFESDPPYLIVGEWAPYVAVIIVAVLYESLGVEAVSDLLRVA